MLRRRQREKHQCEKYQWLPSLCTWTRDGTHNLGVCPDLGGGGEGWGQQPNLVLGSHLGDELNLVGAGKEGEMSTLLPPFLLVLPLGPFQACPSISPRGVPKDSAPVFPAGPMHSWDPSSWDWYQGSGDHKKGTATVSCCHLRGWRACPAHAQDILPKWAGAELKGSQTFFLQHFNGDGRTGWELWAELPPSVF